MVSWTPPARAEKAEAVVFSAPARPLAARRRVYVEPESAREVFDAGIGPETVLQSSTMESEVVFVRNLAQDIKEKNKSVYRHAHFYHWQKDAKNQYVRNEKYLMDIAAPSPNKLKPEEVKTHTVLCSVKDREETPLFNFGRPLL